MRQNTHSIIVPMREYNDLKKLEENYHEYCTNIETIYKNILNERIDQLKNKWWFKLFGKGIEL